MPTTISPSVFDLAKALINWPTGASIGCFTGNHAAAEVIKASESAKVSVATSMKAVAKLLEGTQNIACTTLAEPTVTRPVDLFHVTFAQLSFGYKPPRFNPVEGTRTPARVVPIAANDHLSQYMATRFSPGSECDKHLLELEQCFHATMAGGFIFAVVPSWYASKETRYQRWLADGISQVARIELPPDAVKMRHTKLKRFRANIFGVDDKHRTSWSRAVTEDVEVPSTTWSLMIWFKTAPVTSSNRAAKKAGGFDLPKTGQLGEEIEWSQNTFSSFNAKLTDLEVNSVKAVVGMFKQSPWKLALFKQREMMAEASYSSPYKIRSECRLIRASGNMIILHTPPAAQTTYVTVNSIDDIPVEDRSKAVLLKPTRSGLKLSGAYPAGDGIVCRVQAGYGFESEVTDGRRNMVDDGKKLIPSMRDALRKDFDTIIVDVLNRIERAGGKAYMLEREVRPLTRRRRRINRQMCAIPRKLPNTGAMSANAGGGKFADATDTVAVEDWNTISEDIGVEALFPEEYAEWERRAEKGGMNKRYLYGYQRDGIIEMAMKCRVVLADQQGLGKTIQVLTAALLRGSKKILLIVPSRLSGIWADECEDLVSTYFRFRKRWDGSRYPDFTPNVIEYARDCRPENLKLVNIISYDKLKLQPRDAATFKCSRCNMVIQKFYAEPNETVICPGQPELFNVDQEKDLSCQGSYRRWKAAMKKVDAVTGKRSYRKYRVDIDGKEVHWCEDHPSRLGLTDDCTEVIDTRPDNPYSDLFGNPPDRPAMLRQDKMHAKTKLVHVGFNTVKQRDKDGSVTEIKVPQHRREVRKSSGKKFHVGYTFADLLRNRFGFLAFDEVMCITNPTSLRSMACSHLTGKVRIGCTGTPSRGHPQSILGYLKLISSSAVYPEYHARGGLSTFLDRYKSSVIIEGRAKQIPKVKNVERFTQEFSSLILRRVRREPGVREYLPDISVQFSDYAVPMDAKHKAYYQLWLEAFAEFYEAVLAARNDDYEEGSGKGENILAKLVYLRSCAVAPHSVLKGLIENLRKQKKEGKVDETLAKWAEKIPAYRGPPTAVTMKVLSSLKDCQLKNDKALVFSCRQAASDLNKICCDKMKIPSVVIDGRTSNAINKTTGRSPRHLAVEKFKVDNTVAIHAGMGVLAEGFNLGCANHVLINDPSWSPDELLQCAYRIIRPQQTKPCFVTTYFHEGTLSEFQFLVSILKFRSHSEAMDGRSFTDITVDSIPDAMAYCHAILSDGGFDALKRTMTIDIEEIRKAFEAATQEHLCDDEDDDGEGDEENGNGNGG